jgi:ABC-2 type transport system ATP-binding protein
MTGAYAIDVQNLSKKFGPKIAVDNLSLKIKKGEIFGFLGPNGSGKTTSIRMLCGLLTPDSGEGRALGYNIVTESHLIKQKIGYMTQRFGLYDDLTIKENLFFIGRLYQMSNLKMKVAETLEQLSLSTRKNQLASSLSGGWKQRLSLAACMLHEPELLLLDEPTAGVDPKARRDFWEEIHVLAAQGVTFLVSTHYMDEAERCHQLGYISYGKLLATGTPKQLVENTKFYTWKATGDNLNSLAHELQKKPGIEMVTRFGTEIHIIGADSLILANTLEPYLANPHYTIEPVKPLLEDVFIYLMKADPLNEPSS